MATSTQSHTEMERLIETMRGIVGVLTVRPGAPAAPTGWGWGTGSPSSTAWPAWRHGWTTWRGL